MKRYGWFMLVVCACGPAVGSEASEGSQGGTGAATSSAATSSTSAGSPTSSASTTIVSSSTGSVSTPPPAGCECRESTFCAAFENGISAECGGQELCPAVVTDCARPVQFYGCIGQDIMLDDAAMSCALDALANRTPGWFDVRLQDLDTGSCGLEGCSYDRWRVQVLTDATQAVVSNCYQEPLDDDPEVIEAVRDLESPAYFEECKLVPSGGAQLDCLFGGLLRGGMLECP